MHLTLSARILEELRLDFSSLTSWSQNLSSPSDSGSGSATPPPTGLAPCPATSATVGTVGSTEIDVTFAVPVPEQLALLGTVAVNVEWKLDFESCRAFVWRLEVEGAAAVDWVIGVEKLPDLTAEASVGDTMDLHSHVNVNDNKLQKQFQQQPQHNQEQQQKQQQQKNPVNLRSTSV